MTAPTMGPDTSQVTNALRMACHRTAPLDRKVKPFRLILSTRTDVRSGINAGRPLSTAENRGALLYDSGMRQGARGERPIRRGSILADRPRRRSIGDSFACRAVPARFQTKSGVVGMVGEEHIPAWGQVLQKDVKDLQGDFVELTRSNTEKHGKLWDAINGIKETLNNRLPLWATFLIGGLMSIATWGLTHK